VRAGQEEVESWIGMDKTLKSYFFWTHARGSFHYDVMVTLILLFIFVTPHLWDYGDKPPKNLDATLPMQVAGDGGPGLVITVKPEAVRAPSDNGQAGAMLDAKADTKVLRKAIKKALEPITGDEFFLERYQPVMDAQGKLVGWQAWVHK
jgi:hypothetical protein